MAWNPSPMVAAARDFGNRFGAQEVVILFIRSDGRLGYASYGATKSLCTNARRWADIAFDAVEMSRSDTFDCINSGACREEG